MPYNRCLAAWASVCVSMNVATLALVVGAASTGHRSQDGPKMLLPTRLSLCRVRPPGCAGPHRTRLPGCAETHRIKTCPFPESHHAWAGEGKSQHGTPWHDTLHGMALHIGTKQQGCSRAPLPEPTGRQARAGEAKS